MFIVMPLAVQIETKDLLSGMWILRVMAALIIEKRKKCICLSIHFHVTESEFVVQQLSPINITKC